MKSSFKRASLYGSAGLLTATAIYFVAADTRAAGTVAAESPVTRRLTQEQYANTIADVFGPEIQLGGRFEPDMRIAGLLAVGTSKVSVTSSGMEQYDLMAHTIASQVTSKIYRDVMIPCKPANEKAPDEAWARKFLGKVGTSLYPRPPSKEELDGSVAAAATATKTLGDFYGG